MDLKPSASFRYARFAFADMLGEYMRFNRMTATRLAERLLPRLPLKKKKKTGKPTSRPLAARISEWRSGKDVPDDETVQHLCQLLHDRSGDLLRARDVAAEPVTTGRKLVQSGESLAQLKDSGDWRFQLCEGPLKRALNDPLWTEILTAILLRMPDHVRAFLSVEQRSFWRQHHRPFDPHAAKLNGTLGTDYDVVDTSTARESVQYLAMNLTLRPGVCVVHQDAFPGFEYGVVTGGSGVFLVQDGQDPEHFNQMPVGPGSCVGYGASLLHVVIATHPSDDLQLCHFCFPYRKDYHKPSTCHLRSIDGCAELRPFRSLRTKLSHLRKMMENAPKDGLTPPEIDKIFQE